MMNVAFFDFDGTITTKDSLFLFLLQCVPLPKLAMGAVVLSPILLGYRLGIVSNHFAKEKLLAYFFKGKTKEYFEEQGALFGQNVIPGILRPEAVKRIQWHKKQGDRVAIVSASVDEWLRPWCATMDIDLLSTELLYNDGRFTGTFMTPNCYGEEKVLRIGTYLKKYPAAKSYGYGDSKGDNALLEFVDEGFFKNF